MVCYNSEKKIIYLHIPKTGGMTIEQILIDNYGFKRFSFDEYAYRITNKEDGLFKDILSKSRESKIYDLMSFVKFTFVRNPYDRAFSGIRFLSETCRKEFPNNLHEFNERCITDSFFYVHFIMSQTDSLKDLNNELKFDHIGRFENFREDLENILFNILSFERKDLSKYHVNKSDPKLIDFDHELVKELVDDLQKEDFVNFGY
uniref:Sulfotransferase family protein n=1 Tax=viral metagenome TaxID=1070528 RepID=A0A6C0BDI4_9ZZZZ